MGHHHEMRVVADFGGGRFLLGNAARSDLKGGAEIGLGDEIGVHRTQGRSSVRSHFWGAVRLRGGGFAGHWRQQREAANQSPNSIHLAYSYLTQSICFCGYPSPLYFL